MTGVARFEFAVFFLVPEERCEALHLVIHRDTLLQAGNERGDFDALLLLCAHGRADGCKEVGVIGVDDVLVGESQGADERIL